MTNTQKKSRVLVVDDEKYLLEVLEFDLRKAGYEVFVADDGKEAIKFLSENDVDLIVSDNRMPKVTGVMLLHWVKARSVEHPPFVLMTAFSDIASEEVMDFGAQAFLRKPTEKDELLDIVATTLIPKSKRWTQDANSYEHAQHLPISANTPGIVQFGQGGFFAELGDELPTCFELVKFKLPVGDQEIEGVGQVKWVRFESHGKRKQGVGVEYVHLSEKSLEIYYEHLATNKPRAYIPLGEC